MQLPGSVALVTGGSSGLGAALARALAAAGAHVIVHGRDEERTHAIAEDVHGYAVLGDLADPRQATAIGEAALAVRGRIDLLVSNAGRGWSGPFTQMTASDIDDLVAVNLTGPIQLVRVLLPSMARRSSGHLCFVTSVAGRTGVAGESAYAATKAGVDAFADSLRLETAGSGVRVSVVVPGVIDTPFFTHRGRPYDRARPRPIAPERVAAGVVRGIRRDAAEVWVPRWLRAADVVKHTLPGPYRTLAARFGERPRISRGPD